MWIDRRLKAGDVVSHFKRDLPGGRDKPFQYMYVIEGVARYTENMQELVTYRALYTDQYGEYVVFARPFNQFVAEVDKKKYPEAKQRYVFEKVKE